MGGGNINRDELKGRGLGWLCIGGDNRVSLDFVGFEGFVGFGVGV